VADISIVLQESEPPAAGPAAGAALEPAVFCAATAKDIGLPGRGLEKRPEIVKGSVSQPI